VRGVRLRTSRRPWLSARRLLGRPFTDLLEALMNAPTGLFATPTHRRTGRAADPHSRSARLRLVLTVAALACGSSAFADVDGPVQLRRHIDRQVGGIDK